MPLRYLGIAKLDRADGVGHPIGTDVERIGKQRLARMNRCALPDVVADIVRVALSHHLDVAAAGGPDGAANAVPGVTEATAMGPNGVSDAGHLWLLMRCGPADETHRAARTAHGQSPRRQDTCRPGDRPTRAGSSWPRVSPRSRPGADRAPPRVGRRARRAVQAGTCREYVTPPRKLPPQARSALAERTRPEQPATTALHDRIDAASPCAML